jgi:hypothetical protein
LSSYVSPESMLNIIYLADGIWNIN